MRRPLFLLFCLLFAIPAQAAEKALIIRPVYEQSGGFGFCLGEQTYEDGRKISFALSGKKELNIGLTVPKAGFRKDQHYDLGIVVGKESARTIRTRAISNEALLLQMGGNGAFLSSLRKAETFSIGAGGKTISYNLPLMDKFIDTLDLCVKDSKDKTFEAAQKEPAPIHPQGHAPQTTRNMTEIAKEETKGQGLPPAIYNMLAAAGLSPIEPLSMDDIPEAERPTDFIWQTGSILGGVREIHVPDDKSLTELIGLHINGLKKKCDGEFKANIRREVREELLTVRTAEATCTPRPRSEKKPIIVGLVFYLTPDKIFSILTHEGFLTEKDKVLSARDKIAQTLIQAAREKANE